jgi:hypothetical protein
VRREAAHRSSGRRLPEAGRRALQPPDSSAQVFEHLPRPPAELSGRTHVRWVIHAERTVVPAAGPRVQPTVVYRAEADSIGIIYDETDGLNFYGKDVLVAGGVSIARLSAG